MSAKSDNTIVYGAIRELFAIFNLSVNKDTCRWFLRNIFQEDLDPEKITDTILDYLRDVMMSTTSPKITDSILEDFQSILILTPVDTHDLKSKVSRIASKMSEDLKTSCDALKYKKMVDNFDRSLLKFKTDIYKMTSDALIIPDESGNIKESMIELLQAQLNRLNPAAETLQNRSELPT